MQSPAQKPGIRSVEGFLARLPSQSQRAESMSLVRIFREVTGDSGKLWGDDLIGFGTRARTRSGGGEGEWFAVGFAARKQDFTLYLGAAVGKKKSLLAKLGSHKLGTDCIYVKHFDQVDEAALRELIGTCYAASNTGRA
jgi:hypothetical protein